MKNTKTTDRSGYTLIEILVSVTLSLLLMLGVTQMFRNVGDTINDTQATINMAANLNSTAIILRNDLSAIELGLAYKASDLAKDPQGTHAVAAGYLEITEGQGAPPDKVGETFTMSFRNGSESHRAGAHVPPYWTAYSPDDKNGVGDRTVGDNDDILAFTAIGGIYNGLDTDDSTVITEENAEVIWFVRGTNLYRRVLLIKGHDEPPPSGGGDISYGSAGIANALVNLALTVPNSLDISFEERKHRFGRETRDLATFPYPNKDEWYYLRMPTLEEKLGGLDGNANLSEVNFAGDSNCGIGMGLFPVGETWGEYVDGNDTQKNQFWDFWINPNSWPGLDPTTGSIQTYVQNPRNPRAGEDIILTNVIAFDVKVWNPYWVPCEDGSADWMWAPPQFVDLGQDRFYLKDDSDEWKWRDVNYGQDLTDTPGDIPAYDNAPDKRNKTNVAGYGFVLKGRYNTGGLKRTGQADKWSEAEQFRDKTNTSNYIDGPAGFGAMSCVYDSWSDHYVQTGDGTNTVFCDPPYTEPLRGIQVTIRCFDPRSGNIRQVRVTRFFDNN